MTLVYVGVFFIYILTFMNEYQYREDKISRRGPQFKKCYRTPLRWLGISKQKNYRINLSILKRTPVNFNRPIYTRDFSVIADISELISKNILNILSQHSNTFRSFLIENNKI